MITDDGYVAVSPKSPFGASLLLMRVHRIQDARFSDSYRGPRFHLNWLCGSYSNNGVFVNDPAEFGGLCTRCELAFLGPVALPMLYRCYSTDGQLLYIGSTGDWEERASAHESQSPWWPEVARVDKAPRTKLSLARDEERAAIKAEAPLYNKQHNIKRFRRDGHYYVPIGMAA